MEVLHFSDAFGRYNLEQPFLLYQNQQFSQHNFLLVKHYVQQDLDEHTETKRQKGKKLAKGFLCNCVFNMDGYT